VAKYRENERKKKFKSSIVDGTEKAQNFPLNVTINKINNIVLA
jgi:hypothetical protein